MPRRTALFLLAGYKLFDNAHRKEELADFGSGAPKLGEDASKTPKLLPLGG